MARFTAEVATDVLKDLESRDQNAEKMMGDMVQAGAATVIGNVQAGLGRSFASTRALLNGLGITKTYRTPSDGGINAKVGFFGYHPTQKWKGAPVALALIAMAREYGSRSGEAARPFFRKSFNKGAIDAAMTKVQERYGVKD